MQNYKNHIRFNPLHHFILTPALIILLIWAISESISYGKLTFASIFPVLSIVLILLTSLIARLYALKNQDRIIRLEMRQRFFELTGKSFKQKEKQLSLSQIIALRFASDEELLALIDRAINEGLKSKDIKKSIKDWQGDFMRV